MGKEREREIREHGGKVLDEETTDEREILREARKTYFDRGEMPPDIKRILDEED